MAKTSSLSLSIFSAILFVLMSTTVTEGNPHGLTLRLIHRDSPESPLFAGNLTTAEQHLRMVRQTSRRASLFAASSDSPNALAKANVIETCTFMINVGVGTFRNTRQPSIPYFLGFDIGSSTTWLQCEECRNPGNQCFDQEPPLFPSSRSATFRRVRCAEAPHICDAGMCRGEQCRYTVTYFDGSETSGVMAREAFTFSPGRSARGRTVIETLLFGCGHNQRGFPDHNPNWLVGLMGAGWGETSVVTQLGNQANGRFSYCIPIADDNARVPIPSTFIRFGSDVPPPLQGHFTTTLLRYSRSNAYFVNMRGISLNGLWLPIDAAVFRPGHGRKGTVVDSGCEASALISPAFQAVARELRAYFAAVRGAVEIGEVSYWDLCFRRPETMRVGTMPSLRFHLDGGDMLITPQNVFIFGETSGHKYFCLAMLESPAVTLIGAYQQRNQRFTFDMARRELSIGPEACHSGA